MKYLQNNQEFRLNEVLFENRNKAYGAYVLRNESDRILTKSLFVGIGLLAAISITPLIISAFRTPEVTVEPTYFPPPTVIYVNPNDPPAQVKPQPQQAEKIKEIDKRVPEPKKVVTNEKEVVEHPEKAIAGTHTSEGREVTTPTYIPITPPVGPGTVGPPQVPHVSPTKPGGEEIASPGELGQEASYGGGIDSFRKKVMDNFDGSGFEGSGDTMKTVITFVVEKDGTISGIKANGSDASFNNEAIRTIKSIRGAWKPAKNKQGEPVRSYFKFPVSMRFE